MHDLPRGASLLDRLEETGAEFLFGVPTHAIDLLTEMRARGARRLGAVRGFRISGAAAPAPVVAELMQHGIVPQSGYGMTETCSHQYTLPDDPPERIVETCGRACDGYEIRIWRQDDPDIEAAPGEIGEIGGRGASLMLGYFDDQTATEAAFNAQGWFMTGDLGWIDEAGLSARHRPQEGRDHPRRPQHPSGAHRGAGAAARWRSRRRRHSRLPMRGSASASASRSWRAGTCRLDPEAILRASGCGRPVEIRHAGIHPADCPRCR